MSPGNVTKLTHNLPLKVRLPDVEFFINVGDWPLETRKTDAVPVLSWCGSTDTQDIVLPTYEVTHSTLETMRGVTNDLLSVQGNTGNTHTHTKHTPALSQCQPSVAQVESAPPVDICKHKRKESNPNVTLKRNNVSHSSLRCSLGLQTQTLGHLLAGGVGTN